MGIKKCNRINDRGIRGYCTQGRISCPPLLRLICEHLRHLRIKFRDTSADVADERRWGSRSATGSMTAGSEAIARKDESRAPLFSVLSANICDICGSSSATHPQMSQMSAD